MKHLKGVTVGKAVVPQTLGEWWDQFWSQLDDFVRSDLKKQTA